MPRKPEPTACRHAVTASTRVARSQRPIRRQVNRTGLKCPNKCSVAWAKGFSCSVSRVPNWSGAGVGRLVVRATVSRAHDSRRVTVGLVAARLKLPSGWCAASSVQMLKRVFWSISHNWAGSHSSRLRQSWTATPIPRRAAPSRPARLRGSHRAFCALYGSAGERALVRRDRHQSILRDIVAAAIRRHRIVRLAQRSAFACAAQRIDRRAGQSTSGNDCFGMGGGGGHRGSERAQFDRQQVGIASRRAGADSAECQVERQ